MKDADQKPYSKFLEMIGTSTLVMFIMMHLNNHSFHRIFFSETRAYMALLMGATMSIVMFLFMLGMYPNKTRNVLIFSSCVGIFALSLSLARSQATVGEVSWMKAMIPHHSIAILTSEPRSKTHVSADLPTASSKHNERRSPK